jgi:predicted MFS family arabinose efflux permease
MKNGDKMPPVVNHTKQGAGLPRQHFLLLVAVVVDLFGVALVVPLLPQIFKAVGGESEMWGLMASVYSAANIVGGVALGVISDKISRRQGLLLSMVGAGISYALVATAQSVQMLMVSRIIVGLVKQTMTLATAMAADISQDAAQRSTAVGHVSAAVTVGWMSGQAIGGAIAETVGSRSSAVVAVVLFAADTAWVWAMLPDTVVSVSEEAKGSEATQKEEKNSSLNKFYKLFGSSQVAHVVLVHSAYSLVSRRYDLWLVHGA